MKNNKKNNNNISNDVFAMHLNRYTTNLISLKKELDKKKADLDFFKEEVSLRKGLNYELQPKFAYETSAAWKKYIEKVTEFAHNEKIKNSEAKIKELEEGYKEESARVKLISEGVPAWQGYTSEQLRQEYDKNNSM
jgi:hypothetical protein